MIEFESLTSSAAWKILFEIVRTVHNNPEVLKYIKSGKADYFGFDSSEELWEDQLLFRPNKNAEFIICTDYLTVDNEVERIDLVQYVLCKLGATFRDLEDERVLEKVREYLYTFTNYEKN